MKIKWIAISIVVMLLIGCSETPIKEAKVVDSPVEGLEYQCAGDVAYTSKEGIINCLYMPLGFKVGRIKIGVMYDIPDDGIIFPQDIVGVKRSDITNENVQKLTMLLQTLDSDNNPENGINITPKKRKKLDSFIDLKKVSLSQLQEYLEHTLNKKAITPLKALQHLQKSMKKYNINVAIDESKVEF